MTTATVNRYRNSPKAFIVCPRSFDAPSPPVFTNVLPWRSPASAKSDTAVTSLSPAHSNRNTRLSAAVDIAFKTG